MCLVCVLGVHGVECENCCELGVCSQVSVPGVYNQYVQSLQLVCAVCSWCAWCKWWCACFMYLVRMVVSVAGVHDVCSRCTWFAQPVFSWCAQFEQLVRMVQYMGLERMFSGAEVHVVCSWYVLSVQLVCILCSWCHGMQLVSWYAAGVMVCSWCACFIQLVCMFVQLMCMVYVTGVHGFVAGVCAGASAESHRSWCRGPGRQDQRSKKDRPEVSKIVQDRHTINKI